MEIYLIRHTTPAVAKGICYGQADLDVTPSFEAEAAIIKKVLPANIKHVLSSPLQRCSKLAQHLFAEQPIQYHADLMEINCGPWELRAWDEIPRAELDPWMNDFVHYQIPGGESYTQLFERTVKVLETVMAMQAPAAIVAHGGVIRSLLSHVTKTALIDSFNTFKLHYGCVAKLFKVANEWQFELLSNIPHEKEQHKPSYF
jgi:alpha-ribazole phosphatase